MEKVKIIGSALANIPWQEKENPSDIIWRHKENPIMGWNVTEHSARIYNSAVIPYGDGFKGIFRADHKDGIPQLHIGESKDGVHWNISDDSIHWVDENGQEYPTGYAYDPRLVELDNKYYIIWCTDFGGPTIGLGYTEDFKTFVRMENVFIPFNRNQIIKLLLQLFQTAFSQNGSFFFRHVQSSFHIQETPCRRPTGYKVFQKFS